MRRVLAGVAVVVLAAGGAQLVASDHDPLIGIDRDPSGTVAVARAAALQTFAACDDLLGHLREASAERVTAWGLPGFGHGVAWAEGDVVFEAVEDSGDAVSGSFGGTTGAATAPAAREALGYSTTNVQEVGIDEPDTVKTDGSYLYLAQYGRFLIVDVRGAEPVVVYDEPFGDQTSWDQRLLLDGDRLLVIATTWDDVDFGRPVPFDDVVGLPVPGPAFDFAPSRGAARTIATLYDISDRTAPRVVEELAVDGTHVSSRLIGGVVRLVVASTPDRINWVFPTQPASEAKALAANRDVAGSSSLQDWLPTTTYTDHRGAAPVVSEGIVGGCDTVHRPAEFAGFGSLSVLSLDLEGGLDAENAATVLAGGQTVYSSNDTLYVTTTRWFDPAAPEAFVAPDDYTTEIHAFDITDPAAAVYVASGSVPGTLLNQFSMSQHDGDLRVATTEGTPWDLSSESAVRVLRRDADRLVEIGSVGGLGQGERIYSVRYLGDVAYVVTFRETDPLYTVDLSDPEAPVVRGELKILGFSSYLHPVGDGLLLGIGQDATDEGRTLGTQVSLFDVSDLDDPRRVANTTMRQGSSDAEYDHHAFLWWAETGLAMLPLNVWGDTSNWSGAMGFTVDVGARTLTRLGEVSHPPVVDDQAWMPPVSRMVVVGDVVHTISEVGIVTADLTTLTPRATVRW